MALRYAELCKKAPWLCRFRVGDLITGIERDYITPSVGIIGEVLSVDPVTGMIDAVFEDMSMAHDWFPDDFQLVERGETTLNAGEKHRF